MFEQLFYDQRRFVFPRSIHHIGRLLTLPPGLLEGSEKAWRGSWRTPLLSLFWQGSREFHYHTAFMQLCFYVFSVLCNIVMCMKDHKKRGNCLFNDNCIVFMATRGCDKKRGDRWLKKQIPLSYELGHLLLHLFSLQLFLQQNLKSCDAAIALGILLISLWDKHNKHTRNTLNKQILRNKQKHTYCMPLQSPNAATSDTISIT